MSCAFEKQYIKTLRHDVYDAIDVTKVLKESAKGLNVLITGAGRGIGEAIALAFARAGAASITLTARTESELDKVQSDVAALKLAPSPKVIQHVTNVTSSESVTGLFDHLDKEGIDIDVLVCNAGACEKAGTIHESDPETWWKIFEVNVKGVYLPTQTLLRRKNGNRRDKKLYIIATSSIGAITPTCGLNSYQATKSAVNRFIEFVDAGYKDKNVIAHAYHPGAVMTSLSSAGMPEHLQHHLTDSSALAGGFLVWLCATKEADKLSGRYSSANWDVTELLQVIQGGALDDELVLKLRPS